MHKHGLAVKNSRALRHRGGSKRDTASTEQSSERERNLGLICNNTRFLILDWIKVPHLASHALGACLRRLSQDWVQHYGTDIAMAEIVFCADGGNGIWARIERLILELDLNKAKQILDYTHAKQNMNTVKKIIADATFRDNGLPTGSGTVESAIRRVINLRVKGAGLFWIREHKEQDCFGYGSMRRIYISTLISPHWEAKECLSKRIGDSQKYV